MAPTEALWHLYSWPIVYMSHVVYVLYVYGPEGAHMG